MPKKEADILQIRKYLNGELDAKAMHQLERRAQDDPFLMDALEGYGNAKDNQQANLNEISARLKQRITPQQRRIIPFKYFAAAASVLVVLTVGGIFLRNYRSENKRVIAAIVKPVAEPPAIDHEKPDSVVKNQIAASIPPREYLKKLPANNNADVNERPPVVRETMAAAAPNHNSNTRADTVVEKEVSSSVAAVSPENSLAQTDKTQIDKALQGRAAGVIVDNYSKTSRSKKQLKNLITGRVIETGSGSPLIGATVRVAGTNVSTQTNIEGFFTIPADTSKDKLYIANIGYQARQVSAKNRDSLRKIALEPNNSSLNEVVVIGYGTSKKTDDDAIETSAHPDSGWSSFNKYLKKNAVSPDGHTGVVKLSFNVSGNGSVSDVTVTKGFDKADNQKAIDLINNGPAWIGNTNGMPEKVSVRIKFVKAK